MPFSIHIPWLSAILLSTACLSACGGDGGIQASSGSGQGPQAELSGVSDNHYLDLKVDGIRYEARGNPFGPEVTFGGQEVNVRIGGPSVSAVQAGMSTSLGDHDIVVNLLVNDIEPKSYDLTTSRNKVHRSETPLSFSELFFPGSAPYSKLIGASGLVTLDAVEGTGEGPTFRLSAVRGRVTGVFSDQAGGEHDVELSFRYVR